MDQTDGIKQVLGEMERTSGGARSGLDLEWSAYSPTVEPGRSGGGDASWNPWEHFRLRDAVVVSDFAVIAFGWNIASVPDLTYLCFVSVGDTDGEFAGALVARYISRLLTEDWRDRVAKSWLDQTHVVIRPKSRPLSEAKAAMFEGALEYRWTGRSSLESNARGDA